MQTEPSLSTLRPQADTRTVEELVAEVRRGLVRVPVFQRGLKWQADDVADLLDSIFRGYPIGSLLLRKGAAPAARIRVGPLTIEGPESQAALWVIDGQQRLTALTAALARPLPVPCTPDDVWVIYFNARDQAFAAPPRSGEIPSTWVPVAQLLDAAALSEWVHHWPHGGDAPLRGAVFQAGARLRQYSIPLYIVETDDEQALREIFYRTNNSGKSFTWDEVHDALFGHQGEHPSTLAELAAELQQLGMGRPDEEQLLACLTAFKGGDVTRNISDHHRRRPEFYTRAAYDALPALRQVLWFLDRHAEVPHLRLLPRSLPLIILTRFFALFIEPKPRTLDLLSRWFWRLLWNRARYDERTLVRHGVSAIQHGDEEKSAQNLLALVPREPLAAYRLPERFDARAAESRLALLGMAALGPRTLDTRTPIDVASLIEKRDVAAFRKVWPDAGPPHRGPANRLLLPGAGSARRELADIAATHDLDAPLLHSHAISPAAATALLHGDRESFLRERALTLEQSVNSLGNRLAAWSASDRPSIAYILQEADTAP